MFFISIIGFFIISCSKEDNLQSTTSQELKSNSEQYSKSGDTIPPNKEGDTGGDGTLPIKPPKK